MCNLCTCTHTHITHACANALSFKAFCADINNSVESNSKNNHNHNKDDDAPHHKSSYAVILNFYYVNGEICM